MSDEQTRDERGALSDERLAIAVDMVRLLGVPGIMAPEASAAIQDVLRALDDAVTERDRLRAELATARACDAHVEATRQIALRHETQFQAALVIVRAVAECRPWMTQNNQSHFVMVLVPQHDVLVDELVEQARALLASVDATAADSGGKE